jgi:hypothetical protein
MGAMAFALVAQPIACLEQEFFKKMVLLCNYE